MKIIFNDILDKDLKSYLLAQEGIIDVDININDFVSEININFDDKINSFMIFKYIELFQNNKFPIMVGFDKEVNYNYNELKYFIDDICCEYCYMSLIQEMFKNKYIKSVKSNFDCFKPAYDVELIVEYNNYGEEELIKFINENM